MVENCEIINNEAIYGGGIGIRLNFPHPPQFISCRIANNISQESGAGVWCGGGHSIVFNSCEFERDQEIWSYDGDAGFGSVTILNSTLKNTGIDLGGGAGPIGLIIIDSNIDSCYIKYRVDMILVNDSLTNSTISINDHYTAHLNNCVLINTDISTHNGVVEVDSCYIEGDISSPPGWPSGNEISISNSEIHGDILAIQNCQISVDNTTIIGGKIGLYDGPWSWATLNNCIIISNGEAVIEVSDNPSDDIDINIYCSDFFGFDSTGWLEGTPQTLDTSSVYFEYPRFCDAQNGDYTIEDISICAPANNACSTQIGAYGVGCSFATIPTLTEWGMLIMGLLLLAVGTVAIVRRRKYGFKPN